MIAGTFIVPGTEILSGKEGACGVFGGKDAEHVYGAPEKGRQFSDEKTDRFQKYSHAVDKEHKDGSIPHTGLFPAAKGLKGGIQDFQAPSEDAAVKKSNHKFFHVNSIAGLWKNIPSPRGKSHGHNFFKRDD